jgi:lysylphosphatidylglycerol synthetase-like protein (DUF2156 family)
VKRDHRVGRSWPAPLAELGHWRSHRRDRKREEAAAARATLKAQPAAPRGVLRIARGAALWAIAALIAVADAAAFTESYRGLYEWALRHGLTGFWAAAFPLQVDVFIVVGELVLLVAMIDRWSWRERAGAWLVALLGLAVSVAGNIGHIAAHDAQSRGTAAIPPVAAFAALWLGLTVLKRVLARHGEQEPPPEESVDVILPQVPTDAEVAALIALRATTWAGNALSGRQLETRFGLSRQQATRVRQLVAAEANGRHLEDDTDHAVS